jgi:hypothetical protein
MHPRENTESRRKPPGRWWSANACSRPSRRQSADERWRHRSAPHNTNASAGEHGAGGNLQDVGGLPTHAHGHLVHNPRTNAGGTGAGRTTQMHPWRRKTPSPRRQQRTSRWNARRATDRINVRGRSRRQGGHLRLRRWLSGQCMFMTISSTGPPDRRWSEPIATDRINTSAGGRRAQEETSGRWLSAERMFMTSSWTGPRANAGASRARRTEPMHPREITEARRTPQDVVVRQPRSQNDLVETIRGRTLERDATNKCIRGRSRRPGGNLRTLVVWRTHTHDDLAGKIRGRTPEAAESNGPGRASAGDRGGQEETSD